MIKMLWRHVTSSRIKPRNDLNLGSNTGIGFNTARALCRMKAKVIMACRTEKKALAGIKVIEEEVENADVEFMPLDLSNFGSILEFSKRFKEESVDCIIHNAGVCDLNKELKLECGLESMFVVNCLGTYYLTLKLLPAVKKGGRVVVVSAASIHFLKEKFMRSHSVEDFSKHPVPLPGKLIRRDRTDSFHQYSVSKLFMIHMTFHLHSTFHEEKGICFNMLHPGIITTTEFLRKRKHGEEKPLVDQIREKSNLLKAPGISPMRMTWEEGSHTSVFCATDPSLEEVSGKFYDNCKEMELTNLANDLEYRNNVVEVVEGLLKKVTEVTVEEGGNETIVLDE